MEPSANRFLLPRLSIKQKLPLLICVLLLSVIVIFGYTSYIGIKNAGLSAGKERLNSLTTQLSGLLQQSSGFLVPNARSAANKLPIKKYLQSNGKDSVYEAKQALNNAREDTLIPLVELFNVNHEKILSSDNPRISININRDSVLPTSHVDSAFGEIGKLYWIGKRIYSPITVAVADGKQVIGWLVQWRLIVTTPRDIEQLSQLMGAKSAFYFGNDDGSFWTDGIGPIPAPPVDLKNMQKAIIYNGPKGYPVIASAQRIGNSHWLLLIALSEETVNETADRFLSWITLVGAVLIAIGIFAVWIMSRNITNPLNKLTVAASAIAEGNYSLRVDTGRKDELGKLAEAFNIMAVQVRNAQEDLEKKVQHRTAELETANEELEAFSYSVSHDLHAPLRIIDGYATVLSKKFSHKLEDEGTKLLDSIKSKTSRMGKLIDELLNLSYLGKKELAMEFTDMNELVNSVVKEQLLLSIKQVEIKIGELNPVVCDSTLIRQVWSNLISNAIKYSATRGRPFIEINSYKKDNEIIYSIKDNGVGFDMKYAAKLFGVFQRLHNKEFEGSGIGLALVQRVVAKHGGTVWAEAEVDKGAVFYFSLKEKSH
jgi:signal transduction histidine kinase